MIGALVARWRSRLRRSTTHNYRLTLNKLLILLEGFGAPHIKAPRVPTPTARAVTASTEELAKLLQQPKPSLRLLMLLYFQCGLRFAEALQVTPRNWNRQQQTVTITRKGGRTDTVPITPDVQILLSGAGDPAPDIPFIHVLHGHHITANGLRWMWNRYRKACGVNPNLTVHDLRRTAASILYSATKDLRVAQQLLGHKNLTSTLTYLAPLAPEEARRYQQLLRFEHFKSETKQ